MPGSRELQNECKVTVSQQGRIIYRHKSRLDHFIIQDLHDAVVDAWMFVLKEQDGTIQEYQIDTANIPYLTRPGRLQYKVSAGKPSRLDPPKLKGLFFAMGRVFLGSE